MMKKRLLALGCALALVLGLTACGKPAEMVTQQIFAMDTVMDFAVYGGDTEGFLAAAGQEINRLEALLSRTREESDIAKLNAQGEAVVDADTLELLNWALYYNENTGGAFDMTMAPLVSAWGIHTEEPRVVPQEEIDALLTKVGSEHVHVDGEKVSLDEGCAVDLGGIAKGYASAQLAGLFEEYGITGGWVSLGGNVFAYGTKDGGQGWTVGIADPHNEAGNPAAVTLSNQFAVTSGGYQRFYTAPDGTVYQHILDPKTGAPAVSDLLSVTIICKDGTMADAYSTALYVMGEEGAVDFWREHSEDFDLLLITQGDRVLYTPGLEGNIVFAEGGRYTAQPLS